MCFRYMSTTFPFTLGNTGVYPSSFAISGESFFVLKTESQKIATNSNKKAHGLQFTVPCAFTLFW